MKNIHSISFWSVVLLAGLASCKKAAYLTDDGLHNAEVNLSTYDYLASHPHGMFDTLLLVIDHFGLKDEINNSSTFWAVSDYSIDRYYNHKLDSVLYYDENATYSFEQFLGDIDVDSVRSYIYNGGQYDLVSAPTSYQPIANVAGLDGFAYHKLRQPQGQWSFQPVYYLYYLMIRGEADQVSDEGVISVPRGDRADVRILCQTSGIKTASGTLLNVLANTHTFIHDFNPNVDLGPIIEETENGVIFTYSLSIDYNAGAYTGTSVTAEAGELENLFGLSASEIISGIGANITYYAVEPDGTLNPNSTANAPGHWFGADGGVVSWGTDAMFASELRDLTFNIVQYPGHLAVGSTYTFSQALVYETNTGQTLQATFVFNITVK